MELVHQIQLIELIYLRDEIKKKRIEQKIKELVNEFLLAIFEKNQNLEIEVLLYIKSYYKGKYSLTSNYFLTVDDLISWIEKYKDEPNSQNYIVFIHLLNN